MRTSRIGLLPVNIALLAIGIADLATTLYWVRTGQATEVNPIMAVLLDAGMLPFVVVKLSTLISYVAVTEWYRRNRNAAFARATGNITVVAYLNIYAISFAGVNPHILPG